MTAANPISDNTRHEIEVRAYQIWEREGRPQGREHVHWLMAEAEILDSAKKSNGTAGPAKRKATAGKAAPKLAKPAAKTETPKTAKSKKASTPKTAKPA